MIQFKTHKGEIVTGVRLQAALDKVAADLERLALAIRREDAYASHVTEAEKDRLQLKGLAWARDTRAGIVRDFTTWQRVDAELTGKCVGLLP